MSKSLEEVHASVGIDHQAKGWRAFLGFMGPAYMISVGYMDPGNWATDIAGGSAFGYSLLWVLLMSNLMALLLQSLSARLGIVAQRDLAQASRAFYPTWVNWILYLLAELAIAACDLAEVLGMAIGLHLLTGCSIFNGVLFTVLDTFLLLFLIDKGIRKMEAFIIALVAIIGLCLGVEVLLAQPHVAEVAQGLVPTWPQGQALYIAIGIIGATVMPHNLYLHSSLVQTRKFDRSPSSLRKALRFNGIDSTLALNLAFLVNASLLILAATVFHQNGLHQIADIVDAHRLLAPLLGSTWAPILFAVALIAAGQSSTLTGTLAGQIVMEGYIQLRIQPWVRRIMTRLLAIIPALITIGIAGEGATGQLLIFSQVILSMQLGFAIIPLIQFVSSSAHMQGMPIGPWTRRAAWLVAAVILCLNFLLIYQTLSDWTAQPDLAWPWKLLAWGIGVGLIALLGYLLWYPRLKAQKSSEETLATVTPHELQPLLQEVPVQNRKRIAIAVDFTESDLKAMAYAFDLGGVQAEYVLIHAVESVGALFYGAHSHDREAEVDAAMLDRYVQQYQQLGFDVQAHLGFGKPVKVLRAAVAQHQPDLLVMGTHGHRGLKDWVFGTTINRIRHHLPIPVLLINAS